MSLRLAGRAGEVGPADLGQARRSLKVELRPAGVAAAGGRAGDIAAADLGQGGAAPAGVTAAGGRAGEVGPADLGQAPRSLRQGRCTEHASRGARLSDHCVCAGSEQEAGRAAPRGMLHAVSAHMRAVFASYPHASHALKFWLHARRIDCALDHCVCAGSEQEAGRAAPRGMLHAVSAHMRAVFASYPHASHALKFWLHARRIDCALAHAALFARLPACIARFPTRADGQVALSFHALASSSHWFRVRFYRVGHDMPCWPSCCSDRTKCKIRNMKSWLPPCSSRGLSGERHHSQHRNKRFDRLSLRAGVQGAQGCQLR